MDTEFNIEDIGYYYSTPITIIETPENVNTMTCTGIKSKSITVVQSDFTLNIAENYVFIQGVYGKDRSIHY
eukprot:UN04072